MLYLKYDNEAMQDGIGAQVLRIVSLSAIADYFKCGFVNSPLIRIAETFADQYASLNDISERMEQINRIFTFPNSNREFVGNDIRTFHEITNREFFPMLFSSYLKRQTLLANICLPFPIINRFPQVFNNFPEKMRELQPSLFNARGMPDVVIHLRLGYGEAVTKNAKGRYLPVEYYIQVLRKVIQKLGLTSEEKIVIHTDVSPRDIEWNILTPNIREELLNLGIDVFDGKYLIKGTDLSEVFSLHFDREIEYKYCADFLTTLLDMSQARFLIMGRSALSYLAGLMNPNKVIWPNNHGHPKMMWWDSSIDYGIDSHSFNLIAG